MTQLCLKKFFAEQCPSHKFSCWLHSIWNQATSRGWFASICPWTNLNVNVGSFDLRFSNGFHTFILIESKNILLNLYLCSYILIFKSSFFLVSQKFLIPYCSYFMNTKNFLISCWCALQFSFLLELSLISFNVLFLNCFGSSRSW